MSNKAAATYHGRDVVDRLRLQAPYTEDGGIMTEAADEIERLRAQVGELVELHEFFRDRYFGAVRTINREADLHEHCDVSQATDV